jgi:hypothetical protein
MGITGGLEAIAVSIKPVLAGGGNRRNVTFFAEIAGREED